MSGCWRRLRQGSKRELPERAALFLHPVHLRGELSRAARGGWQRLLALHGVKGVFSFRREYPLLIPQRKARGVPLDPRIGSRALEGLPSLRSVSALLFFVSIRFGLLLFSLPLCLRFVSLQQSPSTLDFIRLAGAYRGGIAALAASFALSVEGDYTAPTLRFESGSG